MATPSLQLWPDLPVSTVQNKLFLETIVVFGDVDDILSNKLRSDADFTVGVRRLFMPGYYSMHIVGPDTRLGPGFSRDNAAILCRDDVDPKMIHALLIDSNCDQNHQHPELTKNFISRYDWMHARNWGAEDTSDEDSDGSGDTQAEKLKKSFRHSLKQHFDYYSCYVRDLVFFVNADKLDDIIAGKYTVERASETIFLLMNYGLPDPVIGFAINTDTDMHSFIASDYHYACLLTDRNSQQNFAFVFGDLYVNKYLNGGPIFAHDVQRDQFTYDIEHFMYSN